MRPDLALFFQSVKDLKKDQSDEFTEYFKRLMAQCVKQASTFMNDQRDTLERVKKNYNIIENY